MNINSKAVTHAFWGKRLGNPLVIVSSLALFIAAMSLNQAVLAGILLPIISLTIFLRATTDAGSQREGIELARGVAIMDHLDYNAVLILNDSKDSKTLFRNLVKDGSGLFIVARLALSPNIYSDLNLPPSAITESYLEKAKDLALSLNEREIAPAHLFGALLLLAPELRGVNFDLKIKEADILNVIYWQRRIAKEIKKSREAWRTIKIKKGGGIGADWAFGTAYNLERYSHDLTSIFENNHRHLTLFGREREVSALERALSKAGGANAILVGEAGVGKRSIVLGLAERMVSGSIVPALRYKKLIELDVTSAIAGAAGPREVEARLIRLLNEATRAGNIVLFIDDIPGLIGVGGGENVAGRIDASEVLTPYLKNSSLQIIGTATPEGFRAIESHPNLQGLLGKVEVLEPALENCIRILEEVAPRIENKNRVILTYKALIKAVELADRYIHDAPFPEKAIDLLDQAAIKVAATKKMGIVFEKDVEEIVEEKTKIKVGEATAAEKSKLLNLEAELHRRIVGQEEAISALANAMRRARAGIERGDKPIGSFMFLGPTGVGKTETARALAEIYFGSEAAMIRLDMSEYQEQNAVQKFIGAPGESGMLTEAVREKPFTLLLFDELEKSHPQIRDLFLQMLDDGRLTDGKGRTIDFKNTIIIATSNAGAELIREALLRGTRQDVLKIELLDALQKGGVFRPEFLNRFDGIITFMPLTLEEVVQIIGLMIKRLEASLIKKDIRLELTEAAKIKLAKEGYSPVFGARQLERVIRERVENYLARVMLSGQAQRGSTIVLDENEV